MFILRWQAQLAHNPSPEGDQVRVTGNAYQLSVYLRSGGSTADMQYSVLSKG